MRINISKVWFILISLLSISLCSTASEYQCEPATRGKKFNVVFFKPDSADNAFWKLNQNFADAVADDLNINLKVVNIERVMFRSSAYRRRGPVEPPGCSTAAPSTDRHAGDNDPQLEQELTSPHESADHAVFHPED